MRDIELYRHLLGIESPWTVASVKLDLEGQRVDVLAEHQEGELWACPECGKRLPLYDHTGERQWRHLDSCQFKTYLRARTPRVECAEHGVRQVALPWAEPHSRFTSLFERLAIDVLRETSVLGATRVLRISWDEAWHLVQRAVGRGLAAKEKRVVPRMGIDEKAFAKRQRYVTLVTDLDGSTVEYVGEGRTEQTLVRFFVGLTDEQLEGIEGIALDMWEPYVQIVKKYVPGAEDKIVFDRFHIMSHMTKAVDRVRRREHRDLLQQGNETLKGTRQLWLYAKENVPEKHQDRLRRLQAVDLKTARAFALKENLRRLWTFFRAGWAILHWKHWYRWATHSRLPPVIDVARMIYRHLRGVLNFYRQPITNAVSEGLNSAIQKVKQMASGFRNIENFMTAIYFHCGGLRLYPVTHRDPR